jgi:hypothetical protein
MISDSSLTYSFALVPTASAMSFPCPLALLQVCGG